MAEAEAPILPAILSGGAGTRLWPLSRRQWPKQLQPLAGPESLLAATADRLREPGLLAPPLLICSQEHRFVVAEQMRGRPHGAIVLEPAARGTAPAAAVAALLAAAEDPARLVLLAPSDHAVADPAALRAALRRAAPAAAAGRLVAFGIAPDRPESGYGYIAAGPGDGLPEGCHAVERFIEKPDAATAARLIAAGGHYWNAGLLLFRADAMLDELARHAPAVLAACRAALAGAVRDLDFLRLDPAAYGACPADSVDYAVMERTRAAAVAPVEMGWSDVGSWSSLWEIGARDAAGNVVAGDVALHDSRGSYLRGEGRLVAAVGLRDMVVVATADAVLVAPRDRAQEVRHVVDALAAAGRPEAERHPRVHRPWGSYETIGRGDRYQVKRLVVRPGARLSLQRHHHRAEHWVVVQGTAKVTLGAEERLVFEDESVYIPVGAAHRLENPGRVELMLIEVQSGTYLGEDDIVRLEDDYRRD